MAAIRKKIHKIDKKQVIDAFLEMAKARKIEKDLLQGIIEDTIALMVKRKYGAHSKFEIVVNMQKGDIDIYLIKQVVDEVKFNETEISVEEANKYSATELKVGDNFTEELTLEDISENFGRRLVLYASQMMNQKINDFERNTIYNEYIDKVGQLIIGEVFQKRGNMMLVLHNGVEMKLMREDQISSDNLHYKKGRAIKAVIKSVTNRQSGNLPDIVLSRKSDEFVLRIFEAEIPEMNEGVVQVKGMAREAGERMKIAVVSVSDRVDAVGACVGLKGIRISALIKELGNEHVDLIHWNEDPKIYIEKAMMPARVKSIEVDEETKTANVIVTEDYISMAIGRNGQNIRLASKLTGYEINVLKEGGEDIEIHEFVVELGEQNLAKVLENKIKTAKEFLDAEPELLFNVCGISYEIICEVRRVIHLEFDQREDSAYIYKLKAIAGVEEFSENNNPNTTNTEKSIENSADANENNGENDKIVMVGDETAVEEKDIIMEENVSVSEEKIEVEEENIVEDDEDFDEENEYIEEDDEYVDEENEYFEEDDEYVDDEDEDSAEENKQPSLF